MQFVHRIHTLRELAEADRCVVCTRAATKQRTPHLGAGASTQDLASATPPAIALCDLCDAKHEQVGRVARGLLIGALVLPLALIALVCLFSPLGTPLLVPLAGFAGLLVCRAAIAWVARARARATPALYVDGAGEDVILQVPVLAGEPGSYRAAANEKRVDGIEVKPVAARVPATLAFVASTLGVCLGSWFGWFAAFPIVFIDDPSGDATMTFDKKPLNNGITTRRQVHWGTHELVVNGTSRSVYVPFGVNVLVSTSNEACYEVQHTRNVGKTPILTTAMVRGGYARVDDAEQVARTPCHF